MICGKRKKRSLGRIIGTVLITAGLLTAAVMLGLSGCALFGGDQGLNQNPVRTYDYSQMKLVQLEELKAEPEQLADSPGINAIRFWEKKMK